MRLSLLLLALGGAPMALGQNCPEPDTSVACIKSYDPVTCNGCTYENLCQAEAAGQTDCQMACAEPAADAMCTKEYAPVACGGSSWCIYDNLCLALASGKEEVDCVRSCPPVPEGVACTADYSIHFCGGCFYDNKCLATAAWEAVGLSADSCVDVSEYLAANTCPKVPDGTACTLNYDPVTCDGDCVYDNSCLSDAAGATGCASTTCPNPDANVACTADYDPVICPGGCIYSNDCLAKAAGITDTCSPLCPDPAEGVACTADYAPVLCPGGSCQYSNSCLAEAAGFTDCAPITTVNVAASGCPTIDGEVACTLEFAPVTCDGDCEYDNSCLAEAAGATNCQEACPVPDSSVACTREYAPVACGGTRWCLYDNFCLAEAAGQQEVDCTRDCPEDTGDIVCTQEYDPVLCGGCFYSNKCAADAAWVTTAGLPESSCVTLNTVTTQATTCPEIVIPSACDPSFVPVTCEDGNCFYSNQCLADEAGATGCVDGCPVPDENECGNENLSVICKGGCIYNNECLATAANFDPSTECAAICRFDLETVGAACPKNYEPVFCHGCTFDNQCIATALGFGTDICQPIAEGTVQATAASDMNETETSGGSAKSIASVVAVAMVLMLA